MALQVQPNRSSPTLKKGRSTTPEENTIPSFRLPRTSQALRSVAAIRSGISEASKKHFGKQKQQSFQRTGNLI